MKGDGGIFSGTAFVRNCLYGVVSTLPITDTIYAYIYLFRRRRTKSRRQGRKNPLKTKPYQRTPRHGSNRLCSVIDSEQVCVCVSV